MRLLIFLPAILIPACALFSCRQTLLRSWYLEGQNPWLWSCGDLWVICWASVGVRNKYLTPLTGFFVNLDTKIKSRNIYWYLLWPWHFGMHLRGIMALFKKESKANSCLPFGSRRKTYPCKVKDKKKNTTFEGVSQMGAGSMGAFKCATENPGSNVSIIVA